MSNLNAPHFQNADKARQYLEAQVWPNGRVCPHCGTVGEHYELHGKTNRAGLYKCADCREPFTVTVGTVFERSKIGLHIWLQAVFLINSSKKGMSAKQLERMLGVTYKTAWFMSHRIREAMTSKHVGMLGGAGGIVEADETYWGNKPRSKAYEKKKARGQKWDAKEKIVSLVERGGQVRSFHVAKVTGKTLKHVLTSNIHATTNLMTDDAPIYRPIGAMFNSHEVVKHSTKEYARGDVTTNTVEGYFSILKRGLIGTFHHVGAQHLQRYVNEFDFRYNNRVALGIDDIQRTNTALKGISGKRLTYRRTGSQ